MIQNRELVQRAKIPRLNSVEWMRVSDFGPAIPVETFSSLAHLWSANITEWATFQPKVDSISAPSDLCLAPDPTAYQECSHWFLTSRI